MLCVHWSCWCHEPYLQIFTHYLALSGSSRLLSRYPLLLPRLRLCSTLQLGLSLWPQELDKPPWSREDGAGFSIPSSDTLLVERVERLNSFKNRCEGLQRDRSLTIFLYNPSVFFVATAVKLCARDVRQFKWRALQQQFCTRNIAQVFNRFLIQAV